MEKQKKEFTDQFRDFITEQFDDGFNVVKIDLNCDVCGEDKASLKTNKKLTGIDKLFCVDCWPEVEAEWVHKNLDELIKDADDIVVYE